MPELATYQGRMDVAKAREWWRTGKYLGGMIVEGETKDVCVTVSNIVNNLFAAHEELTAANLDLTERVLYAERERDEAKAGHEAELANIHAQIADGGTSCHWCMDKAKKDERERCARIVLRHVLAGRVADMVAAKIRSGDEAAGVCEWDIAHPVETACGDFNAPYAIGFKYCPFCGRKIKVKEAQ